MFNEIFPQNVAYVNTSFLYFDTILSYD